MRLIVNLLSDQPIPNLQFIKEFYNKEEKDHLLFISTEYIENKGIKKWILNASDLTEDIKDIHTITVNPYDFKSIQVKLENFNYDDYEKILVNVTGGTKIMSIATYDYFNFKKAGIFYITGTKGECYQLNGEVPFEFKLNKKVTLKEYLTAFGFKFKITSSSGIPKDYTKRFYKWFIEDKTTNEHDIISGLNEYRRKGVQISNVNGLKRLLLNINFPKKNQEFLNKYEIKYLTGEWFEEFIYNRIKEELKLGENLMTGVVLERHDVMNEYDVVFLYNNQLHLIECKTYIISQKDKTLVNDTIYKSSSLIRQLGIFAQSYIFTLNKEVELKQANLDRAKELKIKIVTIDEIIKDSLINKLYKE